MIKALSIIFGSLFFASHAIASDGEISFNISQKIRNSIKSIELFSIAMPVKDTIYIYPPFNDFLLDNIPSKAEGAPFNLSLILHQGAAIPCAPANKIFNHKKNYTVVVSPDSSGEMNCLIEGQ
ncbi:MAG: hypothetical protein JSR85_00545 [Proteobacteria bacterium]|nr:hypothetical protein [Pseudomonadota bacterium]